MKAYVEIGERIRQVRDNLTQRAFAQKLGLSLMGYLNYESGARIPSGPVLLKLAELGRTSVDWLLTGSKQRFDVIRDGAPYKLEGVTLIIFKMLMDMSTEQQEETLRFMKGQILLAKDEKRRKKRKHEESMLFKAADEFQKSVQREEKRQVKLNQTKKKDDSS